LSRYACHSCVMFRCGKQASTHLILSAHPFLNPFLILCWLLGAHSKGLGYIRLRLFQICFKGTCACVVSTKSLRCGLPARLLERRRWLRHGCSAGRMPLLPPFVRRRAGYGLLEPLAHGTRSRCARASEQVSSSSSAVEYLQPQQLRYGIGGRRELYQLWEISTLSHRQ